MDLLVREEWTTAEGISTGTQTGAVTLLRTAGGSLCRRWHEVAVGVYKQ